MASMAEQAGMFMTCPFQNDCQDFIGEHTTVSPEATAQNMRAVTQELTQGLASGQLVADMWSGQAWERMAAARCS